MKLKKATIDNPHYMSGLGKLCQFPMNFSEAYLLAQLAKFSEEEHENLRQAKIAAIKKHGGIEKNGSLQIEDPEKAKEASDEITKELEKEIEVPLEGAVELPADAKLTPFEAMALRDIITIPKK